MINLLFCYIPLSDKPWLLRSQYQGLEGKRDRSNYDYSKLKKEEEEEIENSVTSKPKGALV